MARMPAVRSIFLTILWIVGLWFLLILIFAVLPSPPYSWDAQLSDDILIGNRITRVYRTDHWFDSRDDDPRVRAFMEERRWFFAIDLEIERSPRLSTVWLHVGNTVSLNLTSYQEKFETAQRIDPGSDRVLDDFSVDAKFGDYDGINPPWFWKADAMLLFWDIHRDSGQAPLKLEATNHTISIWPESSWWHANSPPVRLEEPMLQLEAEDGFKSTAPIRVRTSTIHKSFSPSRTFPIRRFIQSIIVPTGLFVLPYLEYTGEILIAVFALIRLALTLATCYVGVVMLCWLICGRPQFSPWFRSFILTRHLSTRLRALGVEQTQHREDTGEHDDNSDGKRKPQPLQNLLDFFRSQSPLDDLLVTFEVTKHLVEPISWRRNSSDQQASQVTSMPNDIKLNVTRRTSKSSHAATIDIEKGVS